MKLSLVQYGVFNSTVAVAPPRNVLPTAQNSTAISVEWDSIERCEDANGNIVGYCVRYQVLPEGSQQVTFVPGSWDSGSMITLIELTPLTTYSIEVALENDQNAVGVFSEPVVTQTADSSM